MQRHWAWPHARFVVAALAFSLCVASCGRPDLEEDTTISGRVYDSVTLDAIEGAVVTSDPPSSQVRSNAEGLFVLKTGLKSGLSYRISASRAGYRENHATVALEEGRNHEVDLPLDRAGPLLAVDSESLQFGGRLDNRQLLLENQGNGSLQYEVSRPAERWLVIEGPMAGSITDAAVPLTVRVNRTGLERGSYGTSLAITSNGGNLSVAISLEVLGPNEPRILVDPLELSFGTESDKRVLSIQNMGTGVLQWDIRAGASWISVDPVDGETTGETDEITVTVNRQGQEGEKKTELTITSNDRMVIVPVTMSAGEGGGGGKVPPKDFSGGSIERTIPAPGERPAGLTYDGSALWIGDLGTKQIYRISTSSGEVLKSFPLPDSGLIDVAHVSGHLFLSFSGDKLYRMDPHSGKTEAISQQFKDLKGLSSDGKYLVIWEGGLLKRRDPSTVQTAHLALFDEEGKVLSTGGDGNLYVPQGSKLVGGTFSVALDVYDVSQVTLARETNLLNIPADIGTVTGVAAKDHTLWLTGTGYGGNSNRVVQIRLH